MRNPKSKSLPLMSPSTSAHIYNLLLNTNNWISLRYFKLNIDSLELIILHVVLAPKSSPSKSFFIPYLSWLPHQQFNHPNQDLESKLSLNTSCQFYFLEILQIIFSSLSILPLKYYRSPSSPVWHITRASQIVSLSLIFLHIPQIWPPCSCQSTSILLQIH